MLHRYNKKFQPTTYNSITYVQITNVTMITLVNPTLKAYVDIPPIDPNSSTVRSTIVQVAYCANPKHITVT